MSKDAISPKTAFVISPIGTPGTEDHRRHLLAYNYIVKKALLEPDWLVVRADEEESPDSIGAKVIERIVESDLIVAVLTDQNPNVFYELAVAHGYLRPVVLLCEKGQRIPFDVTDQRTIFYDLTDPESVDAAITDVKRFSAFLGAAPDDLAKNPLTQFGAFKEIRSEKGGDAVVLALNEVTHALSGLSRRVDVIEQGQRRRSTTTSRSLPTYMGSEAGVPSELAEFLREHRLDELAKEDAITQLSKVRPKRATWDSIEHGDRS